MKVLLWGSHWLWLHQNKVDLVPNEWQPTVDFLSQPPLPKGTLFCGRSVSPGCRLACNIPSGPQAVLESSSYLENKPIANVGGAQQSMPQVSQRRRRSKIQK